MVSCFTIKSSSFIFLTKFGIWEAGTEWAGGPITWGDDTFLTYTIEYLDIKCYDENNAETDLWPIDQSSIKYSNITERDRHNKIKPKDNRPVDPTSDDFENLDRLPTLPKTPLSNSRCLINNFLTLFVFFL